MAGAFSDYLEGTVLNWLRGTAMPTPPAQLWVGLFTATPPDTGTYTSPADGTEVVATNAYSRISVSVPSGVSGITASGTAQTFQCSFDVTFAQATGAWGTIQAYGVWDSPSQLAAPAAPTVTGNTGTGSAFTATQTVNVQVSYVTQGGETTTSASSTATISSNGNNVVVTLPSFPPGVLGMNVYASTASGSTTLYKVTSGSAATSTTSAGTVTISAFAPNSNASPPASNTSQGNLLWYDALTSSQAVNNSQTASLNAGQVVLLLD